MVSDEIKRETRDVDRNQFVPDKSARALENAWSNHRNPLSPPPPPPPPPSPIFTSKILNRFLFLSVLLLPSPATIRVELLETDVERKPRETYETFCKCKTERAAQNFARAAGRERERVSALRRSRCRFFIETTTRTRAGRGGGAGKWQ